MSEDDIEKLVNEYAHEYWAADRTVSRREDAECDAAMDRIMGQIKAKSRLAGVTAKAETIARAAHAGQKDTVNGDD